MDYSNAIQAVKAGKKVRRKRWLSPDAYVELADNICYTNLQGKTVTAKLNIILPENTVRNQQMLAWVTDICSKLGWYPDSDDLLADDWEIYEEAEQ